VSCQLQSRLKPRPHQRQCRRNRQHCVFGNNVAGFLPASATLSLVWTGHYAVRIINSLRQFLETDYTRLSLYRSLLAITFPKVANRYKLITSFTKTKVVTTSFKITRPKKTLSYLSVNRHFQCNSTRSLLGTCWALIFKIMYYMLICSLVDVVVTFLLEFETDWIRRPGYQFAYISTVCLKTGLAIHRVANCTAILVIKYEDSSSKIMPFYVLWNCNLSSSSDCISVCLLSWRTNVSTSPSVVDIFSEIFLRCHKTFKIVCSHTIVCDSVKINQVMRHEYERSAAVLWTQCM